MNLYQNDTVYTKNEFLKEIDSYKMTVEDILIILPNLFTHAITYSTLKKSPSICNLINAFLPFKSLKSYDPKVDVST